MDSNVLAFGQYHLVLGVNWSLKTPVEAKEEAKKATTFLIRKSPDGNTASLATVENVGSKSAKLIPAGALIGILYPEAIVFHPLGDDKVWLCAISRGMPLPGMDVITTQEEAKKQVQMLVRTASGSLIGALTGAAASFDQVLSTAEERIKSKLITKKDVAEITFQRSGISIKTVILVGLGLALVAVAGVGAIQYKSIIAERKKLEDAAKRALQSEAERRKIEERLNKLQADFDMKVEQGRKALESGSSVRSRWESCELVRKALPISLYGFKPEKLTCNFSTHKAAVEWRPGQVSVKHSDRSRLPMVTNAMDFEAPAVSEWSIPDETSDQSSTDVPMDQIRFDIGTWAATYIKGFAVGKAEELKVSPPAELREARQAKQVVLGHKATWSVQGSGTDFLLMLPTSLGIVSRYTSEISEIEWLRPSDPGRTAKVNGKLFSSTKQ